MPGSEAVGSALPTDIEQAVSEPAAVETGSPRILVVDDERTLTRVLRSMLEHDGYRVEECSSTIGLVERVVAAPPDLMLLDYHMPGMSGLDVLSAVQERLGDAVPVILLTGESESIELAVKALKRGALDFLVKPVAMDRLLSTVRAALRTHLLRRELRRVTGELAAASGQLAERELRLGVLWSESGAVGLEVGPDRVLRRLSRAAEVWLGSRPGAMVGRSLAEVAPALASALQALAPLTRPGESRRVAGTDAGGRAFAATVVRVAEDGDLLVLAPAAGERLQRRARKSAPVAGPGTASRGPRRRSRG